MIGARLSTIALAVLFSLTPSTNQPGTLGTASATERCHVAGDSIAVGLGPTLKGCSVNAKVGIPSIAVLGRVASADYLIVSAGSNDPTNPRLGPNLAAICARATGKVIWVLPAVPAARSAVMAAAAKCSKTAGVVAFPPGRDHVHPRAYGQLGRQIQGMMK